MFKEQFLKQLHQNFKFKPNARVFVAVSGGVDSMVLLHLLSVSGLNISVLHCNFGLRAEASDLDEALVVKISNSLEIPCFVKRFSKADFEGKNIQATARKLRYDWFESQMAADDFLATAHHKNDQAENLLMALAGNKGLGALSGMAKTNQQVIRPFLAYTKSEILDFALQNHIEFREDASNAKDVYERNFMRNQVVPLLATHYDQLLDSICSKVQMFSEITQYFTQQIEEKIIDNRFLYKELGSIYLKDYFLFEVFKKWGFNSFQMKDFSKALSSPNNQKFYSKDFVLVVEVSHVSISTYIDKVSVFLPLADLVSSPQNGFSVIKKLPDLSEFADRFSVYLPNIDGLVLRNPQVGDRFRPFGMKGSKLLSDFFTDEKVNSESRKNEIVLAAGTEVLWVVGRRKSENARVSNLENLCFYVKYS